MGCASTIGWRESGAVWSTVPLWPSLIPFCESRITGLRAPVDAAEALDTAKTVVSEAAMVKTRTDWSERKDGMSGPVECKKPGCAENALPYRDGRREASRYSPRVVCGRRFATNFEAQM